MYVCMYVYIYIYTLIHTYYICYIYIYIYTYNPREKRAEQLQSPGHCLARCPDLVTSNNLTQYNTT